MNRGGTAARVMAGAIAITGVGVHGQSDDPMIVDELNSPIEAGRRTEVPERLDLPAWTEEDRADHERGGPVNLGGGLWPSQVFPLQPVPARPEATPRAGLADADGASTTGGQAARRPPTGEIDTALAARYFGRAPASRVVDPQRLIPEMKARELERFLGQQARDGRFDIRLLVFAAEQRLPAEVSLDELYRHWFGTSPQTVLALYFDGEPQRAQVVFSPEVQSRHSNDERASTVSVAVANAMRSPFPGTQLDDFVLQLSINVFDLHRRPAHVPLPAAATQRTAKWGGEAAVWWGAAVAGGSLLTVIAAGILWRRRMRNSQYYLPEFEVRVRLGAPHSGGAGVIVSWE